MSEPILRAVALKKHYPAPRRLTDRKQRHVRAVDGISFDVPRGGTLGIMGESGCGKSTTARLVLQLEAPTSGELYFDGELIDPKDRAQLISYRRQVQAVFQDPYSSLNGRRTIFDAIAEPLHAAGGYSSAEIDSTVREMLDLVGLPSDALSRLPHEFSGGQRQRVAIARGLILKPRLLVLDEPVSALDVSISAQILNLLMDLQEELGLSYLLISHDLGVVSHMCDRTAVIYLGHLVEQNETGELVAEPQHPYTQALFSSVLPTRPGQPNERIALRGPIPSPMNPPSGCVFRTRCPKAQAICSEQTPPEVIAGTSGQVACHFAGPTAG